MIRVLQPTRILLAFFLFFTIWLAHVVASPGLPSPKQGYSHDAKGLEKQYEPFLKALAKRDAASMNDAYKVFFIPEQDKWFASYFRKEDVEQLGWDQEAENENEKKSLITITNLVGRGTRFHAHCKPASGDRQTKLAPRSDAFVPLQPVPVEQFEVEFVADNGKRFSILGNFVYVDEAFRFVGKGAYPFWSMPDATAPKH
ncbi:MAG TPA: hypothetical protein VEI73_16940 [Candidatus Acidoferrum sp.]|nr:hypothetical protein [Candidatus Acidoferrum sp.]